VAKKRVFKTRSFARWSKKHLDDEKLCEAAREIENGQFEADLGGGVCKKRIALEGKGKSGSTRALVAHQCSHGIFFLLGRDKSAPGSDFDDDEVEASKILAKSLKKASNERVDEMIGNGAVVEIPDEKDD